jgi:hypothetical protein
MNHTMIIVLALLGFHCTSAIGLRLYLKYIWAIMDPAMRENWMGAAVKKVMGIAPHIPVLNWLMLLAAGVTYAVLFLGH